MTDFKVGDRVKLKDDFDYEKEINNGSFLRFLPDLMGEFIGKTFNIEGLNPDGCIECGRFFFHPDWLELVEREETAEEKEESILQEAQRIVNGARQADYSDPVKNFEHIARIASAILNKEITPEECCIVMIAVKHAREQYKHKRDNLVDVVGYEEILYRIKEAKK